MTKIRAFSLARAWLEKHGGEDLHGPVFRAWAQARELNAEAARAVKVAAIRLRNFGAVHEAERRTA
ncbi:MAG: hypothetical protein JXO72_05335 [Vicinamibacteria bacterium]|nr:hypothetical protein [Vicinamibacteria bacterium]